jgi:hypothetical protein
MTDSIHIDSNIADPRSAACKYNREFELPLPLLDAACNGSLVVFAGAGISTENRLAYPVSFYDEIRSELRLKDELPFKVVMDRYCDRPNGRALLLNAIRNRFDRAKVWPEIGYGATRFHQAMATIPQLQDIVTTNWDDFFEEACNAVPFVTGEDFVFWNTAGRKVFKIHGSINSLGSLVATSSDYVRCYDQLRGGLIGSSLRMMLATRPVFFVGYSLKDAEFVRLYELLVKEMGGMNPHPYILCITDESATRFREMGMTPIVTDATYFIESLKTQMVARGVLLDESRFEGVQAKRDEILQEHATLSEIDSQLAPAVFYTGMFQDGFHNALRHVLASRPTGFFFDPSRVHNLVHHVNESLKEMESLGRYEDMVYLHGQLDGFIFVVASDEDRKHSPNYFVCGTEDRYAILTRNAFVEDARRAAKLHPKAYERAVKILETQGGKDLAIHHTPHLYC